MIEPIQLIYEFPQERKAVDQTQAVVRDANDNVMFNAFLRDAIKKQEDNNGDE